MNRHLRAALGIGAVVLGAAFIAEPAHAGTYKPAVTPDGPAAIVPHGLSGAVFQLVGPKPAVLSDAVTLIGSYKPALQPTVTLVGSYKPAVQKPAVTLVGSYKPAVAGGSVLV